MSEPKKSDPKEAERKKSEPKKGEPKKAEPKEAEPKGKGHTEKAAAAEPLPTSRGPAPGGEAASPKPRQRPGELHLRAWSVSMVESEKGKTRVHVRRWSNDKEGKPEGKVVAFLIDRRPVHLHGEPDLAVADLKDRT